MHRILLEIALAVVPAWPRLWRGLLPVMLGFAGAAYAQSPEIGSQIEETLNDLKPRVQAAGRTYSGQTLAEFMEQRRIPGASIAVFQDGRIVYARGFGVTEAGKALAVTPDTLFQAASISKAVTATAALALVEQGTLALDEPVNNRLRTWRIPDSAAAAGEQVTLRRLLNHTAGLTVSGFPGYPAGTALPTVVQILDGVPPANTAPVRIDRKPGTAWRYSGGGFTVAQLLMTDVTGEAFPELMHRLVLAPAGMARSTFAQPLAGAGAATVAAGHGGEGRPVAGGHHVYPEMAAAGLWTTPSDLARWALALSAAFRGGDDDGALLRPETARAMLSPGVGNWGLGLTLGGTDPWLIFAHNGSNAGFRAAVAANPRRGDGVVVMTNSESGEPLLDAVTVAVARVLGWPAPRPSVIAPVAVAPQALADAVGRYAGLGLTITVEPDGELLAATISNGTPPSELIPLGNDRYVASDGTPINFIRDPASDRIVGIVARGATFQRVSAPQ